MDHLDAQNALREAMEQRILARIDTALGTYKVDNEIAHQKLEARINGWSTVNSFGVGLAILLDYFFGIRK